MNKPMPESPQNCQQLLPNDDPKCNPEIGEEKIQEIGQK